MKLIRLLVYSSMLCCTAGAQTVTVLNDSTELQQFEDGQKLKVNYFLNGSPISVQDKEKLVQQDVYLKRDFNIRNKGSELIGEINFITDEQTSMPPQPEKPAESVIAAINLFREPVGRSFPVFHWTDIKGTAFSKESLAGKVVVLNFWYTTCGPCIAELPLLNELAESYTGKNVVFIAASWNTPEQLAVFFKKNPFRYNQVASVDPRALFDPMPGWPIHVVLDTRGFVRFAVLGKQPGIEKQLANVIDDSLSHNYQP